MIDETGEKAEKREAKKGGVGSREWEGEEGKTTIKRSTGGQRK